MAMGTAMPTGLDLLQTSLSYCCSPQGLAPERVESAASAHVPGEMPTVPELTCGPDWGWGGAEYEGGAGKCSARGPGSGIVW